MNKTLIILGMTFLHLGCSSGDDSPKKPPINENEKTIVEYVESTADFANPDRGFYRYSETWAGNYSVLDETVLKTYRESTTVSSAAYKTINTLLFRYFILDGFTDGPISEKFLENMKKDFEAARKAGIKLIPRFTYTVNANVGNCPEGFICPPYGDAPKEIVLQHIEQLSPVLTNNADVISALQMGFIGTWGENYYTDYFGDASSNGDQRKLLDKNWEDRLEVLKALLDNTPQELMVQVRYPQIKQRYVYGINAGTGVAALDPEEAFTEADKARIGFHNDCLLASEDDFGTYEDYGNSSSPRRTDIANLKSYFEEDSKYVIVGGETCSDNYSPENDCAPAGIADIDLRALHYTYLNAHYNNEVNNDWVDGGCMEDIKKNLGYRLVLTQAVFPKKANTGENIEISINIENRGFASPVHVKNVELVLREKATSTETVLALDVDVRRWGGKTKLEPNLSLPNSLKPGEYELFLKIEDIHEQLQDRPEYSIRLANEKTWEPGTGYNSLKHSITIK